MTNTEETASTCPVRILVVEDEESWRDTHRRNLVRWGYQPVIAEGNGEALFADAQQKARDHRCQLALVDMRLRNSRDIDDTSGLELVPSLNPTRAIIVTAATSDIKERRLHEKIKQAYEHENFANFIGKEDGPGALQEAVQKVLNEICCFEQHVIWPDEAPAESVVRYIVRDRHDPRLPPNEAEELICRMFPKIQQIILRLIQSGSDQFDPDDTMRRRSFVFITRLDNQAVRLATKIARVDKVQREIENYEAYVQTGIASLFVPVLEQRALLWDIGGVAYRLIGNNDPNNPNGPRTLRDYYRSTNDISQLMRPIEHFFGLDNWGNWYRKDVRVLSHSLFEAYDAIWRNKLSDMLHDWRQKQTSTGSRSWLSSLFPRKSASSPHSMITDLYGKFPDPIAWLEQHKHDTLLFQAREAITHGDLHANNLFVDTNGTTWPIDFERTGYGPILRDFVELTHDILTRLARIGQADMAVLYDIVLSLCEPRTQHEEMRLTRRIQEHAEGYKAWQMVRDIRTLARQRAQYDEPREYLWGLLLNSLLVATLLEEHEFRREKTLLVASIICVRLDHWGTSQWVPDDWPPFEWIPA